MSLGKRHVFQRNLWILSQTQVRRNTLLLCNPPSQKQTVSFTVCRGNETADGIPQRTLVQIHTTGHAVDIFSFLPKVNPPGGYSSNMVEACLAYFAFKHQR
jgi:hypothetical protein